MTLGSIPLYCLLWTACARCWNTAVSLQHRMAGARADVSGLVADAARNGAVVRAYQDEERVTLEMCDAVDGMLRAGVLGGRTLKWWLQNRVTYLWSFFMTATYMVGLANPARVGAGTLGLCLYNLLLLEALVEASLESATAARSEFVALARVLEYFSAPQEKARQRVGDERYRSRSLRVGRADLGELSWAEAEDGLVEVRRRGRPVLRSAPGGTALVAAAPADDGVLWAFCPALGELRDGRRLVAVGAAAHDARAMALELCGEGPRGPQEALALDLRGGWLADGAALELEGVKAGYADTPRDALRGVSLSVRPGTKVGVLGPAGSGKSSLLLVILRVIEPRGGRVLIGGVDTRDVGLATLRAALGFVPQDHPYEEFTRLD